MTCPLCDTLAGQEWEGLYTAAPHWDVYLEEQVKRYSQVEELGYCRCLACGGHSVWVEGQMVHPRVKHGSAPQPGMPADVLAFYEEARTVAELSPRSAATLLRVSLEVLVNALVGKDVALNKGIGQLVHDGRLPDDLQKAMDTLRITGNESAHPSELRLDDDREVLTSLFEIVNLLVERLISVPERIDRIYGALPPDKLAQIGHRDGAIPPAPQSPSP